MEKLTTLAKKYNVTFRTEEAAPERKSGIVNEFRRRSCADAGKPTEMIPADHESGEQKNRNASGEGQAVNDIVRFAFRCFFP